MVRGRHRGLPVAVDRASTYLRYLSSRPLLMFLLVLLPQDLVPPKTNAPADAQDVPSVPDGNTAPSSDGTLLRTSSAEQIRVMAGSKDPEKGQ